MLAVFLVPFTLDFGKQLPKVRDSDPFCFPVVFGRTVIRALGHELRLISFETIRTS